MQAFPLQGGAKPDTPPRAWFMKRVENARSRDRYRGSDGPHITHDEVVALWKESSGCCAHCGVDLQWEGWTDTSATLDRVDGSRNRSYHRNARWLCRGCNSERAGWELAREYRKLLEKCESKRSLRD